MKKSTILLALGIAFSLQGLAQDIKMPNIKEDSLPQPKGKHRSAMFEDTIPKMQDSAAPVKKKAEKQHVSFGIQGGLNYSSVSNTSNTAFGNNNFSKNSKPGYNLGLFVDVPVLAVLHVQPELNYSMKGFRANTDDLMFKRTFNFIDLPILIKFYPVPHLYVYAGPQISLQLSTYDTWTNQNPDLIKNYQRGNKAMNKLYGGIVGGIGVDIAKHFILNAGFASDISYMYKTSGHDTPEFRNEVFTLRAGYRF